ncbi:hypothetical protein TNIN_204971 [Trichonephila inaurata madagascariensis]|uniref:Uncharacterized protein n=1 Tax=Trichonephila inaurata madagascariensis TaxID=2747483 RepID=A0A8X6YRR4_9ARAC|nr:hypothetical protein TNIN_204971 [Trichonephila inaurata madagascariensis]
MPGCCFFMLYFTFLPWGIPSALVHFKCFQFSTSCALLCALLVFRDAGEAVGMSWAVGGSNLVGQRLAWDQPFRRSTGSLETRLRILSEPLRGLPREETIAGFGGKFI